MNFWFPWVVVIFLKPMDHLKYGGPKTFLKFSSNIIHCVHVRFHVTFSSVIICLCYDFKLPLHKPKVGMEGIMDHLAILWAQAQLLKCKLPLKRNLVL